MKRQLAALLGALVLSAVIPAQASAGSSNCQGTFFGGEVSTCSAALGWRYDASSKSFNKNGVIDPSSPSIRYEYVLNERCGEGGVDCGAAVLPCAPSDGQPGRMYQSQAFPLSANGSRSGEPSVLRNVCLYAGKSVPLAAVEAAVREEIQKRIPQPSVTSAPPGQSVVNFFTIFSTQPSPEQAITFTNPVPGEVRAVPEYSWDFGDGIKGLGPGTAFNPAILPSRNPGYYLGATYAKPGTKHVTLTVTWRVTFRLEGVIDVPLAPIVMTATEDKPIATARAVLVR